MLEFGILYNSTEWVVERVLVLEPEDSVAGCQLTSAPMTALQSLPGQVVVLPLRSHSLKFWPPFR